MMKKKALSIILSVIMIIGMMPSVALAYTIEPFIDPEDPDIEASKFLEQMEQPIQPLPDDVVTPYSKENTSTLLEKSEIYYYNPSPVFSSIGTYKDGKTTYKTTASLSKTLQFTKAVSFDPTGSGKRNHVAVLGYAGEKAWVYIINGDTNTLVKEYTLNGWYEWAKYLDTVDSNNFFSITAGDYDGDGRDSLVVYTAAFQGSNGMKEIRFDNNSWKEPANISVTRSGNEIFSTYYTKNQMYNHTYPRDKLSVALESDDVDNDGIDDLVVVSSGNNISPDFYAGEAYKASIPKLAVVFGKKNTSFNNLSVDSEDLIYIRNSTATIAAPDVSIGDIDGDGKKNIVIAGFFCNVSNGDKGSITLNNGSAAYFIYSASNNKIDGYSITEELEKSFGELSAISYGDSLRTNENTWQQFSVECVQFDGINTKPYVFLNGYLYEFKYDSSKKKSVFVRASGSDKLDVTDKNKQNDDNFAFNFLVTECNKTDVNEVFIRSATVGNTMASNGGKEVLNLIVGFKTNKNDRYFSKLISIYKDNSGNWKMDGAASAYLSNDTYSGNGSSGICLSDIDVHNDSIIVRYNSTLSAYTDPNVVAFLQAAPYFSEFGAGNSSTTYSYSESYSKSTTSGKGYSCGVGISASVEAMAVTTEVETTITSSVSEDFTNTLTTEFSTTFEANDHNQVIVRRTLLHLYCYDLLTGFDDKGNPIYEDCGVVLTVPQHPVLTSLSMEQYDGFAKLYNEKYGSGTNNSKPYYLDVISKNNDALQKKYFLNNEGNPYAYASSAGAYSKGYNMSKGDAWMELSHSGGTSQQAYSTSVGTEYSKTTTDGVSLNTSIKVGSSFAGFGASVGISSSLESLRSSGVSTAQVTTTQTGGSVQNMQNEEDEYNFSWQLIGWKTAPSDSLFNGVPFVGYAVKNISAPPICINDLSVVYSDKSGEATLKWTAPEEIEGRMTGKYFHIFRTDGQRTAIDVLQGNPGDDMQFKVSSNTPSATYVIVSSNYATLNIRREQHSIDSNEVLVVFSATGEQVNKLIESSYNDLKNSIDELKNALESGQSDAIQKAIADLTKAYKDADALITSQNKEDLKALEDKLKEADSALKQSVDVVQKNLDKASDSLKALIESGDKANTEALQKAISDMTAAYEAADALLKSQTTADLSKLESKMNTANATLKESVDAVQKKLDETTESLKKLIDSGDSANYSSLRRTIEQSEAAYQAALALLKKESGESLSALESKMTSANTALQSVVDSLKKELKDTKAELNKAIKNGDAKNTTKLETQSQKLTEAYQAADTVLKSNVKDMNTDRENGEIVVQEGQESTESAATTSSAASTAELGADDLRGEIDDLRKQVLANQEALQAMAKVNEKQESKIKTLKIVSVLGLCISSVSLLGNLILLYLYLRKKHSDALK